MYVCVRYACACMCRCMDCIDVYMYARMHVIACMYTATYVHALHTASLTYFIKFMRSSTSDAHAHGYV